MQFRIDLRHERAQMELFRESARVEIPHRRCLYFRRIDLRIVDRLPSRFRDQIADRFSFLLQVAFKISSAAAENVNRFHGVFGLLKLVRRRLFPRIGLRDDEADGVLVESFESALALEVFEVTADRTFTRKFVELLRRD